VSPAGDPNGGERLRILLASDHYPPFIGGVQRQVQLLGRELRRRGHEVEVATVWSPGCARREDDEGVTVHRLRQVRSLLPPLARPGPHHPPPFPDPATVAGLRRVLRRLRPQVVDSYGWISYSCAAALLGTRTPLVLSARDYGYSCATCTMLVGSRDPCSGPALAKCLVCASHYHGWLKGPVATLGLRAFGPLLRRRTDVLHSISRYVRDITVRDFLDRGDAHAGRAQRVESVVLPSFRESGPPAGGDASALSRLPDEPFILFVGALRREKGVVPLLAAYTRLEDPRPPLVLLGTRERDTPTSLPPGVVVVTDAPHAAVMEAWRRCLFGVAPSLWPEPLGSVVYEGMSAGKAVVGTVPGGHADMIEDRVSGRLVPAGDADALGAAMRELIDDSGLRDRLGVAARVRSRRFTADAVVPALEAVYRSAARARR
jgi:glycosyltransferase involved in cell wall biosynthesis